MFVFFFKQKTAYEMRISDWSSDVCSSDLVTGVAPGGEEVPRPFVVAQGQALARPIDHDDGAVAGFHPVESGKQAAAPPLLAVALPERLRAGAVDDGRSEERRGGKEGVSRVDLGGSRIIKKQVLV